LAVEVGILALEVGLLALTEISGTPVAKTSEPNAIPLKKDRFIIKIILIPHNTSEAIPKFQMMPSSITDDNKLVAIYAFLRQWRILELL